MNYFSRESPRSIHQRARRAQGLFADILGGGEDWGCRAMPILMGGGVRADRSESYVFARPEVTSELRSAIRAFAGSEHMDVIAVEYGHQASDAVQVFAALRRKGMTLQFSDYRFWRLESRPLALAPMDELRPTLVVECGRLSMAGYRPWRSEFERTKGFSEGGGLAQSTIWTSDP